MRKAATDRFPPDRANPRKPTAAVPQLLPSLSHQRHFNPLHHRKGL